MSGKEPKAPAFTLPVMASPSTLTVASRVIGNGVVIEAEDPALAPIVTPLVTSLQAMMSEARTAVAAVGADVEAQATAAAPYIASLTAAGVQLCNAAGPGITALANAAKAVA